MLTELEAVNLMLDLIGETPVGSIESVPTLPDADRALRFLRRSSKEVQGKGWHCNRISTDVTPDTNGYIAVGSTWLRVDTTYTGTEINATVRTSSGTRYLFNLDENTFIWPTGTTVAVEYIEYLDFENLTPTLQDYIAAKAAVVFQQAVVTSAELDKAAKEQAQLAWIELQEAEAESEDLNVLTNNDHALMITWRRSRFWGR